MIHTWMHSMASFASSAFSIRLKKEWRATTAALRTIALYHFFIFFRRKKKIFYQVKNTNSSQKACKFLFLPETNYHGTNAWIWSSGEENILFYINSTERNAINKKKLFLDKTSKILIKLSWYFHFLWFFIKYVCFSYIKICSLHKPNLFGSKLGFSNLLMLTEI